MTVEMEMMNEENGRLRRHIKTLEAELRKQDAAQAQAAVGPVTANNDEVICPNCCNQFRAIPVNVQQLMLDAGFEPPFKEAIAVEPAACIHKGLLYMAHEFMSGIPAGATPLYASPPVSLQPAHDAVTVDLLNDKVMRQQGAMRLALEALREATSYTSCPSWSPSMTDECNAAIAALEKSIEGPTP